MRPVRVVIYGVGVMGSLTARMCLERGVEIVGAVARSAEKVGRDLGEVIGLDEPLGVLIRADPEALLQESRPDVALVSVSSLLSTMAPHFRLCVTNGVDVITLEEESLFPWHSSPVLAAQVDSWAKAGNASVIATGLQDVYWFELPRTLMSAATVVRAMRGRSTWNSDDYGPEVASSLFIGEKPDRLVESGALHGQERRSVSSALYALAAAHGLDVIGDRCVTSPLVADRDVESASDLVVSAGRVLGLSHRVTVETQQGIELELEMAGYLHARDESSVNMWTLTGVPDLTVITDPFAGHEATCAAVVNRIADVLAAEPGLLSIDMLPPMRHRHGPVLVSDVDPGR